MPEVWTVKAALDWTVGYLERKGDENPRLSAEWLLSEACGMRRIDLYVNFERPLSQDERDVLRDWVARRGAGEPLQYITGEVAFRYLTLKVAKGVLIPRPETEVLVSEGIAALRAEQRERERAAWDAFVAQATERAREERTAEDADDEAADAVDGLLLDADAFEAPAFEPLVIDLCTGSGCIACAIATEVPGARVIATDVAPEAVALARENAEAAQVSERVKVLACDLGAGVPERFEGRIDLVISNPPYVPSAVMARIPGEVRDFEPALALDGGADGLDVFRRIVPFAVRMLRPGGTLAAELHEEGMDRAVALAEAGGLAHVRVIDDLAGRPRVLVAELPKA